MPPDLGLRFALHSRYDATLWNHRSACDSSTRGHNRRGTLRTVITGGAGFIGSHLCERFLAEGHEVLCVDNLLTGSLRNIDHLAADPRFRFIEHNISEPVEIDGPVDNVLHFASPASPVDYLAHPIPTLKVGSLGTHNALGLAKAKDARFLLASTSEVYGDPDSAPPARGLLGERQPDRTARLLRRGQAVRRGHHHGLPPVPRRQDPDRPDLQYVRPEDAAQRRPGAPQLHEAGASGRADHDLRPGRTDPQLLLRQRPGRGDLPPPPRRLLPAGEPGKPVGDHRAAARPARSSPWSRARGARSSTTSFPRTTPSGAGPDITRAQTLLGWNPTVDRAVGLKKTLAYFRSVV